jgi:hypothetical protein
MRFTVAIAALLLTASAQALVTPVYDKPAGRNLLGVKQPRAAHSTEVASLAEIKRMTNAERMRRGLPLKVPVIRASRTAMARELSNYHDVDVFSLILLQLGLVHLHHPRDLLMGLPTALPMVLQMVLQTVLQTVPLKDHPTVLQMVLPRDLPLVPPTALRTVLPKDLPRVPPTVLLKVLLRVRKAPLKVPLVIT